MLKNRVHKGQAGITRNIKRLGAGGASLRRSLSAPGAISSSVHLARDSSVAQILTL
jgi:hypothetical protein